MSGPRDDLIKAAVKLERLYRLYEHVEPHVHLDADIELAEEEFDSAARGYVALRWEITEPLLGLATTKQLLNEIRVRLEVSGLLDYRTVNGG